MEALFNNGKVKADEKEIMCEMSLLAVAGISYDHPHLPPTPPVMAEVTSSVVFDG